MQGKAKLLGHAVHPMLVAFPLGLLSLVWVFDIVHLTTKEGLWAQVAFYMLTCGLAGGLLAAITGFIDWMSIPSNTRAYRVGLTHLAVNLCAVAFFLVSWIFRLHFGIEAERYVPFVLSLIGFGVILVGAWLGGELVEQHGLSVRRDAHLNAPSSLDEERLVRRPTPTTQPEQPQPV